MTSRQRIDTMREARLWVGQIIVPAIVLLGGTLTIPDVREAVATKAREVKIRAQNRIESIKHKN